MNQEIAVKREWTATTLAMAASIAACTTISVATLIILWNVSFFGINFNVAQKFFIAIIFPYMQLMASTAYRSPVERSGSIIKGMIYSDLGDDYVRTTVRRWLAQWYVSVLCFSAVITAIGVAVVSMIEK